MAKHNETMNKLDAKIPAGPLADKWTNYKDHQKLVNPANKRRLAEFLYSGFASSCSLYCSTRGNQRS